MYRFKVREEDKLFVLILVVSCLLATIIITVSVINSNTARHNYESRTKNYKSIDSPKQKIKIMPLPPEPTFIKEC